MGLMQHIKPCLFCSCVHQIDKKQYLACEWLACEAFERTEVLQWSCQTCMLEICNILQEISLVVGGHCRRQHFVRQSGFARTCLRQLFVIFASVIVCFG